MRQTVAGNQTGFTLVEILIVMAISVILFAMSTINLGYSQSTTSLASTVTALEADLKSQQMLAMSGDPGSTTTQQPQGIYFQSGSYTLFAGSTYNPADTNNFTVNLGAGVGLTTTLSSSTVVFTKATGEVTGYTAGSNTVTLTFGSSTTTVTLSRFGAVTVN